MFQNKTVLAIVLEAAAKTNYWNNINQAHGRWHNLTH